MKDDAIERMLKQRFETRTQLDTSFTEEALRRIRLEENASGPKKGYFFMNLIRLFKPLKSMPAAAILAFIMTAGTGIAAVGYFWHQPSVQPMGNDDGISLFQTTGCPNFYKLQNDPDALQRSNLSQTKRFVLRPDIKDMPKEEQQRVAQAYCEINQLRAYATSTWQNTPEQFNDMTLPIIVTNIGPNKLEGKVESSDDKAATRHVTFSFQSDTLWLDTGNRIDRTSIKPGDVLGLVTRGATEGRASMNKSLVFIKLPLQPSFYSHKYQSMLLPLDRCENNSEEDCIKTNALAGVYPKDTAGAYRRPSKSRQLQAKIVSINGDRYELLSRGGKLFNLKLADYAVDFNMNLEVGDYLDIHSDATTTFSQDSIYTMNLLVYTAGDKFSPLRKYRD